MGQLRFLFRLFDYTELKVQLAAFYSFLASFFCAFSQNFMGISGSLFLLLFIIMLTDYATGLKAAKIEGQKFESKKGLGWVFKFGSYMIFLAVSFLLKREVVIIYGVEWIDIPMKLIHFYVLIHIFLWELKSVDENFERLGYSFRILKFADQFFGLIKSLIKRKLGNDIRRKSKEK